jgi:integrase
VAWEDELLSTDAYTRAIHVRGVDKDRVRAGRALEASELQALVRAARAWGKEEPAGLRAGAILALMYGAGLRRAEVANILVDNVDLDAARLVVVGKRGKARTAFIAPEWVGLVREWLTLRRKEPRRLFDVTTPESIGRIMEALRKRAGLAPFTPHDLRRSFGTHLLGAGKDLALVRDLLGHDSVQTTMLYDRRGESMMAEAVKGLAPPEERGTP